MMRVLLAGPLPHDNKNGGVAVFDENFAKELYKNNYSVRVIASFNGEINSKIPVYKYTHTINVLRKFHPDVIISSLAYSALFAFISNSSIKIHLLHGFTNYKYYNSIKCVLMHVFDCVIRKRYTYLLSNSKFTNFINNEIYNIKSDGFFRIGLNDAKINKISRTSTLHKKRNVLYVGRIVFAKHVKLIYKAFCNAHDRKSRLTFIGYGNESQWIKNHSRNDKRISFLGFKNNNSVFNWYQRSKVFISLNPSEPYGITYLEALLNNDFVIAPNTGGPVQLLSQFPNRCRLVDVTNIQEISDAIKFGLNTHLKPFSQEYNLKPFSYEKTLLDIKKFMKR